MVARSYAIDVSDHLKWARAVARGVANDFRFPHGSQEQLDLEQVAALVLVSKARQFKPSWVPPGGDVGGAFRGFAHPTIRCECRREAVRMGNGGTFITRRERQPCYVALLSSQVDDAEDGDATLADLVCGDGRREPPAEPLDELIRREESSEVPPLTPDLLLAVVMSLDLKPVGRYCRSQVDHVNFERLRERRFWAKTLRTHGFTQIKIGRLLGYPASTVAADLAATAH